MGTGTNIVNYMQSKVKSFSILGDKSCEIMLGQYFLFLCHVNLSVFLFIFAIFAKLNNLHLGTVGNRRNSNLVIFLNMLLPVMNWLWTKYQFHLPFGLLIYIVALLIGHIAYFYSLLCEGNLVTFLTWLFLHYVWYFRYSKPTWNWTMAIHNNRIGLDLTFPLICSVIFYLLLFTFCKNYLDIFVDLSKIWNYSTIARLIVQNINKSDPIQFNTIEKCDKNAGCLPPRPHPHVKR